MSISRWFAARLEQGTLVPPLLGAALSAPYAAIAARTLTRPVVLPARSAVIGVGGAVLGGAGKTPVAIAYAMSLANQGCRVAFVAHGYRACAGPPHIVSATDTVQRSGDDGLVAARALQAHGVAVWVGEDRNRTLAAAARCAQVLVVDGLLQTRPCRLARSVLVVDAENPWGAARCPPAGDLRGPVPAVLAQCDEIVFVTDPLAPVPPRILADADLAQGLKTRVAKLGVEGAWDENRRLSLEALRGRRLGLLTLVARPERVQTALGRRGIRPVCVWNGADHRPLGWINTREVRALAFKRRLDAWIVTMKCVTHLAGVNLGCRVLALEVTTRLDPSPQPVLDSPPCVPRES